MKRESPGRTYERYIFVSSTGAFSQMASLVRGKASLADIHDGTSIYPPKSSNRILSRSTPKSSNMVITAEFIIGGPHM